MAPKKCSANNHMDRYGTDGAPVPVAIYNIKTCKKFKKRAIDFLIQSGALQQYHVYLCLDCYDNALLASDHPKMTFSEFCYVIEKDELTDEQFAQISKSFATLLKIKLIQTKTNYTLENLTSLQAENIISCMNNGVREFLINLDSGNDNRQMSVLSTHEHLMQLTHNNYIGPLHFGKTLISYFMSGSRRIIELNAMFSPSGSYATVLDFLKSKSNTDYAVPTVEDCIFFFDNNQIMARSWKVQFNHKPLVSVVTTVVCLVTPVSSNLQCNETYLPVKWLGPSELKEHEFTETSSFFRAERNKFLEKEIHNLNSDEHYVPPSKMKRLQFQNDELRSTSNAQVDPYDDIPSNVTGKTEVVLMEPIFVNPCSFKSLQKVLDNILDQSGEKAWIAVGCDGLPYGLCSKIIDNYFVCTHCNRQFYKRSEFEQHIENENLNICLQDCFKYKKILLIPGMGHMDINITKAIFKLMWQPCIRELALLLGWKSPKALTACQNCTDHHKATQILNILFDSLSSQLLKPFMHHCLTNNLETSIENFYKYAATQNNNYKFLFKCTFTYLLAWKIFKKGMRRGNYIYMKMSMDKLSMLFYGLNMTLYMDLWIRFEKMMARAPLNVRKFIQDNLCMSQSEHLSKAEGGDFILETTNKKVKSFMPYGVPTDERWSRVCKNLNNIEQIHRAINSCVDNKSSIDEEPNKYFRKFSDKDAVAVFSDKLKVYLSQTNQNHTSMDDKVLDDQLVDFDIKCGENKKLYYQNYPNVLRLCERIFMTPEDRAAHFDISNKPKADIQKIIVNLLQEIVEAGGLEESEALQQQFTSEIKNATKSVNVTFYREVVQSLEEVTSRKERYETEVDDDASN